MVGIGMVEFSRARPMARISESYKLPTLITASVAIRRTSTPFRAEGEGNLWVELSKTAQSASSDREDISSQGTSCKIERYCYEHCAQACPRMNTSNSQA